MISDKAIARRSINWLKGGIISAALGLAVLFGIYNHYAPDLYKKLLTVPHFKEALKEKFVEGGKESIIKSINKNRIARWLDKHKKGTLIPERVEGAHAVLSDFIKKQFSGNDNIDFEMKEIPAQWLSRFRLPLYEIDVFWTNNGRRELLVKFHLSYTLNPVNGSIWVNPHSEFLHQAENIAYQGANGYSTSSSDSWAQDQEFWDKQLTKKRTWDKRKAKRYKQYLKKKGKRDLVLKGNDPNVKQAHAQYLKNQQLKGNYWQKR